LAKYDFFTRKKVSRLGNFIARRITQQLLKNIIDAFSHTNAAILEIGPGNGVLAKILIDKNYRYSCIESNSIFAENLRRIGANVYEHEIPPCKINPDSFDIVVSSHVFEHLKSTNDLIIALSEIFAAIRPGGYLIIIIPDNRFWKEDLFDVDYTHCLKLTTNNVSQTLEDSGFDVIETAILYGSFKGIFGISLDYVVSTGFGFLYKLFPKFNKLLKAKIMFHGNSTLIARKPL
jgi:SAM-dependent methyltransferase